MTAKDREMLAWPVRQVAWQDDLEAAVTAISKASGVRIEIDWASVEAVGLRRVADVRDASELFYARLHDLPLADVLDVLASGPDSGTSRVAWRVRNGVVTVYGKR